MRSYRARFFFFFFFFLNLWINVLAQGLNDYIKDAVMNPKDEADEDLSDAQVIWSRANRYRYLPHIFTEWWLSWVEEFPYEQLPSAFNSLSQSDISNYQSRRPLADELVKLQKCCGIHPSTIIFTLCSHIFTSNCKAEMTCNTPCLQRPSPIPLSTLSS